jgi:toxin-antitoxin system PIN domain toxin
MILIDANLLLYAYDPASTFHRKAASWLESVLSSGEPVRLASVTLLAFLRIGTDHRLLRAPFAVAEAVEIVESWLERPSVALLEPGERHWEIWRRLLVQGQARGGMVTDAYLAALAMEHGTALCTTDRDFARFSGLSILNPLEA